MSYDELYVRYFEGRTSPAWKQARRLMFLRCEQDVENVVHEAFLKLFRSDSLSKLGDNPNVGAAVSTSVWCSCANYGARTQLSDNSLVESSMTDLEDAMDSRHHTSPEKQYEANLIVDGIRKNVSARAATMLDLLLHGHSKVEIVQLMGATKSEVTGWNREILAAAGA